MRIKKFQLTLALASTSALAGCGGLGLNGLMEPGDASTTSVDAAVPTVAVDGAPPAPTPPTTTGGGDAATVPDARPAGSSATDSGSVDPPVIDASLPGVGDARSEAEAGPDGGAPADAGGSTIVPVGVRCGYSAQGVPLACAASEICCVTNASPGSFYMTCQSPSVPCPGLPVPCDDDVDCPNGSVCCGQTGPSGQYTLFQCQVACAPTSGQYQMCDPDEQPSECAASQTSCLPSTELPGYYRCSP